MKTETYEEVLKRVLNNTNIDIDKREGSFLSNMASPLCYELSKVLISLDDVLKLAFISTNYDTYLDRRVMEYGIFRKQGEKTLGKIEIQNQQNVTQIDLQKVKKFIYSDREYNVIQQESDYIFLVEAVEVGANFNLDLGTVILASNDVTIAGKVIKDFDNGLDVETDNELRERFFEYIKDNITSGNKAHYKYWAKQVDGVDNVKVYPLWNGNGTVKVLIADADNRPVHQNVVNECYNHISEVMPIGCQLTVSNVIPIDLNIQASIKLNNSTLSVAQEKYEARVKEFLVENIGTIYYSKIFSLLGELEEVEYITDLTLNNQKADIILTEEQVGILSNVILREVR